MLTRTSKAILGLTLSALLFLAADANAAVRERARLRIGPGGGARAGGPLHVITTLPDYASHVHGAAVGRSVSHY